MSEHTYSPERHPLHLGLTLLAIGLLGGAAWFINNDRNIRTQSNLVENVHIVRAEATKRAETNTEMEIPSNVMRRIKDHVAVFFVGHTQCTGVLIGEFQREGEGTNNPGFSTVIETATHCLEGVEPGQSIELWPLMTMHLLPQDSLPLTIERIEPMTNSTLGAAAEIDISYVRVRGPWTNFRTLAPLPLEEISDRCDQDPFYSAGYSQITFSAPWLNKVATVGDIDILTKENGRKFFVFDAELTSVLGNSGSPLWENDGSLCGILKGAQTNPRFSDFSPMPSTADLVTQYNHVMGDP